MGFPLEIQRAGVAQLAFQVQWNVVKQLPQHTVAEAIVVKVNLQPKLLMCGAVTGTGPAAKAATTLLLVCYAFTGTGPATKLMQTCCLCVVHSQVRDPQPTLLQPCCLCVVHSQVQDPQPNASFAFKSQADLLLVFCASTGKQYLGYLVMPSIGPPNTAA